MNSRSLLSSEEDILSSPSSDDKMDTSSESFQTNQDTPNSTQSEFEDRGEELQVQNPNVLRLSEPVDNASNKMELNDSLITKMSKLTVDSPDNRPRNLGISPPKLSSTLISTTSHPLMILNSPDENFPDLIPKKSQKLDEEKDLSLSSIEDEKANTNGYEFYTPQRNTSKNNLYYSENFVTADSNILTESLNALTTPPDVARVDQRERRKISARYLDNPKDVTPQKNLSIFEDNSSSAMKKYLEKKISSQSTPKPALNISEPEEFHSGIKIEDDGCLVYSKEASIKSTDDLKVADWCDSPSQLRAMPNFDLPIEMSSNITAHNDLDSPDVVSSSTAEDKSAYQALLDPYTGSVALRPTGHKPPPPRRKVQVPQEEDSCSLDSVSGCSMESEDEPPPPAAAAPATDPHSDDDTKRSKSTMTLSECSDPIPEYSAAEELQDERAWLTVKHGDRQSKCDMKVIEEFKRVVSHGGYDAGGAALIVFSACHLPDTARPDYRYVMDNLFLYVIWSLERLVTEEYVLVYLHGSAGRRRLPSAAWLHECYKLIDRRLRKSLKHLYLVHPTFWLKSFVIITKPFVSSKFFRKLSYVKSLAELYERVPVEPNAIPEIVKQYDARR